jgi:hypothetical protein
VKYKKKLDQDRVIGSSVVENLDEDVDREIIMSGRLNIGREGNPVTITIEDEVTGEIMEVNNVSSALLVVEETRKSSSGWVSFIFGDPKKISNVLEFLSKITLEGLKKMRSFN